MRKLPSISIIVPVLNEERILKRVVASMVTSLGRMDIPYELILVENGSNDRSLAISKDLGSRNRNIRIYHLSQADYGASLRLGFLKARNEVILNFSVDWVDFKFLKSALGLIAEYDIVLASKNIRPNLDKRPLIRVFGGSIFHKLSNLVIPTPFTDTHGLRMMKRKRLTGVLKKCQMGGEMFEAEMLIRSFHRGLKIVEIPIEVKEYRPSRVSIAKRSVRVIIQLIQLRKILSTENIYETKIKQDSKAN